MYILLYFEVCRNARLTANSVEPDKAPRAAASDLGLDCSFRSVCPYLGQYGNGLLFTGTRGRTNQMIWAQLFKTNDVVS